MVGAVVRLPIFTMESLTGDGVNVVWHSMVFQVLFASLSVRLLSIAGNEGTAEHLLPWLEPLPQKFVLRYVVSGCVAASWRGLAIQLWHAWGIQVRCL